MSLVVNASFSGLERKYFKGLIVDRVALGMCSYFVEMGGIVGIQVKLSDDSILHVDNPALLEPTERLIEGVVDLRKR